MVIETKSYPLVALTFYASIFIEIILNIWNFKHFCLKVVSSVDFDLDK